MRLNYIYNYSYVGNENDNKSLISRFVIDVSGQIKQLTWSDYTNQWNLFWSQPKEQCDVYGICGPFGICNKDTLKCDCSQGFKKRFSEDWDLSDTTGGCVRNTTLQCGIKDDFSPMSNMDLPDNPQTFVVNSTEECRGACADNCSCNAYAYGSFGCSLWDGNLLNTRQQSNGGQDLYLRIAASDIQTSKGKKNRSKLIIAAPIITLGTITLVVLGYMNFLKRKANRKGMLLIDLVKTKVTNKASPNENMLRNDENEGEIPELQLFGFASLAIATNNFCLESKLGEGGFGAVYKGKLENGQEIAVKRLSKSSGQGIKEFKNEVILISKLQHRNLVRLLGCCTEEEENLLIYEYMPNKSLDASLCGYMSPEYIMGGTFSEKSDVFSFGVLILEIVSGRRNNSFYIPEQPLNLLLHTWRLWNEGKWSEIVDQELGDSYSAMEVIRSIHIGLLCVQKRAVDRPTMSTVDFILSNETDRPQPKEPPFTSEVSSESDILQNRCTNNNVTMTTVEGR